MAFIKNFLTTDVDTIDEYIGFKLPLTLSDNNQTNNTIESVKTNLKSLLFTSKGERMFQPNLGVDIRKHLFNPMTEETFASLQEDIIEQVAIWLPFLSLTEVLITPTPDNNLVKVNITFSFKNNPDLTDSVQVDLNTGVTY